MGLNENLKELEETVSSLEESVKGAKGQDRDTIRDAVARLRVKKNLLAGSQWDSYKSTISQKDIEELKRAKDVIEDEERTEEEKAEKVKSVVSIAKRIIGFLAI